MSRRRVRPSRAAPVWAAALLKLPPTSRRY